MSMFLITICWRLLLIFKQREDENNTAGGNGFLSDLAKTQPRKQPEEIYKFIYSSAFQRLDEVQHVTYLQDMVQGLIRPSMTENEVNNARTAFMESLGALVLLRDNRLYGGQSERTIT